MLLRSVQAVRCPYPASPLRTAPSASALTPISRGVHPAPQTGNAPYRHPTLPALAAYTGPRLNYVHSRLLPPCRNFVDHKTGQPHSWSDSSESSTMGPKISEEDWHQLSSEERVERLAGQKRTVALYTGYVGTDFCGLQVATDRDRMDSIDGNLEMALLKANLIAKSNYGDLFKIKWSRSSRTDKGVHSLCTVIGVKIVLPDENVFDTDPEGIELANTINAHLPESIRVFSAQRVNKKFNARRQCSGRSYEYYLPAHVLGIKSTDSLSAEESERLRLFRAALSTYVGTHPFHNFTTRKGYLKKVKTRDRFRRDGSPTDSPVPAAVPSQGATESVGAVGSLAETNAEVADGGATVVGASAVEASENVVGKQGTGGGKWKSKAGADESDVEDEFDGMGGSEEETEEEAALDESSAPRLHCQRCEWISDPSQGQNEWDRVGAKHYRTIDTFVADDPTVLVPGGVPSIRLEVSGNSFMVHQIRHMIGGAVAVAVGLMPLALLELLLEKPARSAVPRAPPHTLLLSGNAFHPFRKVGEDDATIAKYTGQTLELKEGGEQRRQVFKQKELHGPLNELLHHPDWSYFARKIQQYHWPEGGVQLLSEGRTQWVLDQEAARERRLKREAEHAARKLEAAGKVEESYASNA